MEILTLAGAAVEYVQVFADRVVRACLFSQLKVRFDDIGDITQQGGSPLLSVVLDQADQFFGASGLHRLANARCG